MSNRHSDEKRKRFILYFALFIMRVYFFFSLLFRWLSFLWNLFALLTFSNNWQLFHEAYATSESHIVRHFFCVWKKNSLDVINIVS